MYRSIARLRFFIFAITFFIAVPIFGQAQRPYSKRNLEAEVKLEYGFLLSHHLELDIFQSHFPAFELSIQKSTWGKERWETEYAYPLLGMSVLYTPLGGFGALGSAIAVYPFINFPLFKNRRQSLNFRMGLGLGYLTNFYQRTENYKNFAIGSHINVAGRLYFEYRRKLSRRATFSTGFGLTHFSNGSVKTPNYGLNILTATAGMAISLGRPNPYSSNQILPELYPFEFDGRKSLDLNFSFSLALKNMTQVNGEKFMVYATYVNLMKRVSFKSSIGLGLDLVYDGSDKFLLEWNGTPADNTFQLLKPGVNVAYELMMSRLSFLFNVGFYLAGHERSEGDMYQRLTLKYRFARDYFALIALSANFGKAEFVGFGLGYNLNFIYKRKIKH